MATPKNITKFLWIVESSCGGGYSSICENGVLMDSEEAAVSDAAEWIKDQGENLEDTEVTIVEVVSAKRSTLEGTGYRLKNPQILR